MKSTISLADEYKTKPQKLEGCGMAGQSWHDIPSAFRQQLGMKQAELDTILADLKREGRVRRPLASMGN
jgi:hypothetical protein